MDAFERRRAVLSLAVNESDWFPLVDSSNGETLRSLEGLGWVMLEKQGVAYSVTMTQRGLERYLAWGGPSG